MYNANQNEQEVLDFWAKNKTFEKSVSERPEDKPYVFYDGPPFATGLPHYGHLVASAMKDAVPRYQTMNGKRVERVWGWDCHGLPVENIVEKELGTKSKQDIEKLGVDKFNELCRSKVLGYVDDWKTVIHRFGRWVDMDNAYKTMDKNYMESVWWVFKELWDKEYIYKGYRAMHVCPRCETTLSQQEVSEGYKDVKDLSVTATFKLKDTSSLGVDGDVFILAWTTTPWTLPGNTLLAVGADIEYTLLKHEGAYYLVAKERLLPNFDGKEFEVVEQLKGKKLVGLTYEPLFPYFSSTENAFRVVTADFVTTEDGTGVVHIAPAFGEDDYQVGREEKVGWVQHVSMRGEFVPEVTDFPGLLVKQAGDTMSTDIEIVKYLAHNGKLFAKQKFEHSYPHCWRCDTPLLNYATSSWFVDVTKIKREALKLAKDINWSPEHMKEGRFGKWLEGARDWSISRQRFWASVMPVWQCNSENCEETIVFGSAEKLEEKSGQKVDDLHKHVVDKVTFPCEKCNGTMTRIPDVLDTWFDSGSMPYAQLHYPFENEKKFEDGFPAGFITEGQDQTRAWFYYLHILATALKGKPAFKNVIVNGIVLAEDGKKMSKKLKNYPDPMGMIEKYGADSIRYYLLSSPIVSAENLNVSEDGIREVFNKLLNTLWNVVTFYDMFAEGNHNNGTDSPHVLDKWIYARLNQLTAEVTTNMNEYKLNDASRPILDFVLDLSQWYVRRSRDRFKGEDEEDAAFARGTLRDVLLQLSKLMAPFTPFIAEQIYKKVGGEKESVHLDMWPETEKKDREALMGDVEILRDMAATRDAVECTLSLRKKEGVAVRQPLALLRMTKAYKLSEKFLDIIKEEVNVKAVELSSDIAGVWLDTALTDELKKEGLAREVVRAVNQVRKEKGYTRQSLVHITYGASDPMLLSSLEEHGEEIKKLTLAAELTSGTGGDSIELGEGLTMSLLVEKV